MDRHPRVRQLGDQGSRPTRVVEMDVGEDHPLDIPWRKPLRGKRLQDAWHRTIDTWIDDRRLAVLHDQVDRGLERPVVLAVHRADAVLEVDDVRHDSCRIEAGL